ncbi:MAG TPA: hypothetical protein VIU12_14795, partial [Chryseolinea sp.]
LMDYEAVIGPSGSPAPGTVDGTRDLVDFFPVFLNIKELLKVMPPGQQTIYKLKQDSGALNFAYTDLKPEEAGSYLTDLTIAQSLRNAETIQIRSAGVELTAEFLNKIKNDGKGVILLEGRDKILVTDDKPLVLAVCNELGKTIAETRFQISIDGVEMMFRHKNLVAAGGGSGGPPDRLDEPSNYPDRLCSNKSFVLAHGYNVNPESARGWGAEIFKRLYWSGSKAKFYSVTWYGYETQLLGNVTTDYQCNVDNAFATADELAAFLANLSNPIVAAHSLGNMLVGSAIHDWGARPTNYFMIDAAVAKEAYDGSEEQLTGPERLGMDHPDWSEYNRRLWCSDWHLLFPSSDHRAELTWEDRLETVGDIVSYNFYSSGEEVLKNPASAPHLTTSASEVWNNQERMKGLMLTGQVLSSNYGGWAFNPYWDIIDLNNPPNYSRHLPPEQADVLFEQLKEHPFLKPGPEELYGTSGSDYASGQQHRNTLLAEMVPALSFATGANALANFETGNFNVMDYKNGGSWPNERLQDGTKGNNWLHSDVKDIAYIYVYPLYSKFVELGELDR